MCLTGMGLQEVVCVAVGAACHTLGSPATGGPGGSDRPSTRSPSPLNSDFAALGVPQPSSTTPASSPSSPRPRAAARRGVTGASGPPGRRDAAAGPLLAAAGGGWFSLGPCSSKYHTTALSRGGSSETVGVMHPYQSMDLDQQSTRHAQVARTAVYALQNK
jgi:hypothetical protein